MNSDAKKNIIGYVEVTVTRANIIEKQQQILFEGVLITTILILCTVFLASYLSRSITNPIQSLSQAVLAIKSGVLNQIVNTGARGELAILESGINDMSSALYQSQQKERAQAEDAIMLEKICVLLLFKKLNTFGKYQKLILIKICPS